MLHMNKGKKKAKDEDKPKKKVGKVNTKAESKDKRKFLLTGNAAKKEVVHQQEEAVQRKALRDLGKNIEFWLEKGEEKRVTFLDGGLDEDGDVIDTCFHQHSVYSKQLGYPKFACIADPDNDIECPLCLENERDGKESRVSTAFVSVFTILDHTQWKDKDGKKHKGSIRMFVAKPGVAEKLRKYGKKRGGLQGATFDISRGNKDMAPRVGDDFDFVGKTTMKKLKNAFPDLKIEVIDYEKEINFLNAKELKGIGINNTASKPSKVKGDKTGDEDDLF